MPKVGWNKPKPNYLAALFRAYRKERNMTSKDIADALGCTAENVRTQQNKSGREWNVGKLMQYCDVLGIPYADAFEAATK